MEKGLAIALIVWTFFGMFLYSAWPEMLELTLATTMLLSSLLALTILKNPWWLLILIPSVSEFFYYSSLYLYDAFNLPINAQKITVIYIVSTVVVCSSTLIYKLKPQWR